MRSRRVVIQVKCDGRIDRMGRGGVLSFFSSFFVPFCLPFFSSFLFFAEVGVRVRHLLGYGAKHSFTFLV